MWIVSEKVSWYLPGRLYDLAFGGMFRGLRRQIAAAVERDGLYPWLDVCCGTGSQLRGRAIMGKIGKEAGSRRKREISQDAGTEDGQEASSRAIIGLDKSCGFVRYAAARAPEIPFVCGDAGLLPFKASVFRAVTVSFSLHDKSPDVRRAIMAEARRVLAPGGRVIAVDFEKPWNPKSRRGAFFTALIERLAGGEHYRNGRDFLKRGGLRAFLRENGFAEISRRDVESGCLSVVVARDSLQSGLREEPRT